MKILVLGSNGQLGSEIRKNLKESLSQDEYVFYDRKSLDITNPEQIYREFNLQKPDIVINCAAYTNVAKAQEEGYEEAIKINWIAVADLALACKSLGALLIHISTDYVFGGTKNIPYTETDECFPLNWYGHTKRHGECEVVKSGCRYIILRTSWLYSSHRNNFLLTMKKLLTNMSEVPVVVDQVSTPTWAGDLATSIISIINKRQLDKTGIYNYSNEGVASWYDFAITIQDLLQDLNIKSTEIVPCSSEEFKSCVQRPSYTVLDKSLYKQTFNQKLSHWRASLKKCIEELESLQ